MKIFSPFFRTALVLILVACADSSTAASAGREIEASTFPSLAAAVANPRTIDKTIVITRTVKCGNLAVPRNRLIRVRSGGMIDVTGVLDFQGGKPDAGDFSIFRGPGAVTNLGIGKVKWFGAVGDGITEESALVQKAINAVGKGTVLFTSGTYVVANLQLKTGVDLTGQGDASILKLPSYAHARSINGSLADVKGNFPANVLGTTLNHDGVNWFDNGVRARDEGNSTYIVSDVTIKNLVIDGNRAHNPLGDSGLNASAMGAGISLHQASRVIVENCRLINARMDGIHVGYTLHGGSDGITIRNCRFNNNGRTGIALITGKNNKIRNCVIRHAGTGAGIDVEANWDAEINNRHLIKDNYVEGGIALVSARLAKMNDIVLEDNTVVTGPGINGITLSSSQVNGGTIISRTILRGNSGGSAFVVFGDIGPTRSYSSIVIKNNRATNYDYILPAQPKGSMANVVMRDNFFSTKYGLQLYRPYRFDFIGNDIVLTGGSGAAPLFHVLFGQVSVDPDQGATTIRGNTVRGGGVSKLVDTTIGADAPVITPDFLTISANDIEVDVSAVYPMDLHFDVTISGNRFAGFKNSINFIGDIKDTKIVNNEFVASGAAFPLIRNHAAFKRPVVTGNKLKGIYLGVTGSR